MRKIIILSIILLVLASCSAGRTYCEDEQRNVDFCLALFDPVCGSDGKTYSNFCSACKEENIKYWIKGEC